jgi:GrpB-like predicted nucleotidyltransferase (UPF0157 family)
MGTATTRSEGMAAPAIVTLVEHSARWAEVAAGEAARLLGALAGELVAVHHIGSTSIVPEKTA